MVFYVVMFSIQLSLKIPITVLGVVIWSQKSCDIIFRCYIFHVMKEDDEDQEKKKL